MSATAGLERREWESVEIRGPEVPGAERVLTPDAVQFVATLARQFGPRRVALLERRREVQRRLRAGILPDFLAETRTVREGSWTVAPSPADLTDRRVEITRAAPREK